MFDLHQLPETRHSKGVQVYSVGWLWDPPHWWCKTLCPVVVTSERHAKGEPPELQPVHPKSLHIPFNHTSQGFLLELLVSCFVIKAVRSSSSAFQRNKRLSCNTWHWLECTPCQISCKVSACSLTKLWCHLIRDRKSITIFQNVSCFFVISNCKCLMHPPRSYWFKTLLQIKIKILTLSARKDADMRAM